jgi:hypothetical protein
MSRSRRQTPVYGICVCRSERWDKRFWHRRLRARERTWIVGEPDPRPKDVSNPWRMGKDGKRRFDPVLEAKGFRK